MNTAILDSVPIRIYRKDRAGRFIYANAACVRDLGRSQVEEVIGKTDFDFFNQALAERWRQQELLLVETGTPISSQIEEELWIDRPPTWAKTSKILEPALDGAPESIWGISLDITDDYQHLQRYKHAVEGHRDGIWHYDARTLEIWLSPQCHEMLGLEPDSKVLTSVRNWILFVHHDDRARVIATYRSLSATHPHNEVDCRFIVADQREVFARIRLTSEFESEQLVGVSGSVSDRSEYERKYRSLLDLVPSFIFVKDRERKFEFVNHALAEAYGDDPDRMVGKTDADYNKNEKQLERFLEADLAVLDGQSKNIAEESFDHKNGTRRVLTTIKVPRPGGLGEPKVTGVVGVATDITEFARTRRIFEALIDHIPDEVFFKDRRGRYRHVNPAMAKYLAHHKFIDWNEKTDFDFFSPEIANNWKEQDERIFESGFPELGVTWETKIEGKRQWRRTSKVPVKSLDDEVIGLVGITHDLTEERNVQIELHNKTRLLEAVLDTMPLQVSLQSPDGTYQLCNREFAKFVGLASPAMIVGKLPEDVIHDSDACARLNALFAQAQHNIEIKEQSHTELDSNLNRRLLLISLYPVSYNHGSEEEAPSILTIRDNLTPAAGQMRQRHQTQVDLMDAIRREDDEARRAYLVLLGLTHFQALGLNRALLFRRQLRNSVRLSFVLAIGQPSEADAKAIEETTPDLEQLSIDECLRKFDECGDKLDSSLNSMFRPLSYRLLSSGTLSRDVALAEADGKAILSMVPFDEQQEPLWKSLRRIESTEAVYGILPIDDSETWIILADNIRSRKSIYSAVTTGSQETTLQDILGYCRAARIAIASAKQNADHRARVSSQTAWRNVSGEISHRLDNILPFTLSTVRRLMRNSNTDTWRDQLIHVESDLQRAIRLIREFTRYAAPVVSTSGSLRAVRVSDFLKRIQSRIDANIALSILDVTENLAALWLRVDEQLIEDCFRQLAVNTQMHSKMETPACTLEARYFPSVDRLKLSLWHGHYIEILFSDIGIGIDDKFKERIFDPLFTRHYLGTGMGLAIARRVVEAHGGRIRELGALNKGAVFSIILPLFVQQPD